MDKSKAEFPCQSDHETSSGLVFRRWRSLHCEKELYSLFFSLSLFFIFLSSVHKELDAVKVLILSLLIYGLMVVAGLFFLFCFALLLHLSIQLLFCVFNGHFEWILVSWVFTMVISLLSFVFFYIVNKYFGLGLVHE